MGRTTYMSSKSGDSIFIEHKSFELHSTSMDKCSNQLDMIFVCLKMVPTTKMAIEYWDRFDRETMGI